MARFWFAFIGFFCLGVVVGCARGVVTTHDVDSVLVCLFLGAIYLAAGVGCLLFAWKGIPK